MEIEPGRGMSADQVGMAVVRAAKRAGLQGVSLHTLRYTFISRLVQAGWPLPEVAAFAGHRDIKVTLRYAHLAPSYLRQGIAMLERQKRRPGTSALSTETCVTLVSREKFSPNLLRRLEITTSGFEGEQLPLPFPDPP